MNSHIYLEILAFIGAAAIFFAFVHGVSLLWFKAEALWEMAVDYKRWQISEHPSLTEKQRKIALQYLDTEMPKRFSIDKYGFVTLKFKNLPTVTITAQGRRIFP
jgi:hypothetical protein